MAVPDDSEEKWILKKHTIVKHQLLKEYLHPWSVILGKYHNINIFDCFAGRGRYTNSKEGSPLIIIKTIVKIRQVLNVSLKKIRCIFIEKNKNNYRNLVNEIKIERNTHLEKYNGWLEIYTYHGECEDIIYKILDKIGEPLDPSFFFIDPNGFSGYPFEMIKKILSIPRTEVFLTLMTSFLLRFGEYIEKVSNKKTIERQFGTLNISKMLINYSNLSKDRAYLEIYRKILHENNVRFTFPFQINDDEKRQIKYFLLHCANHIKGAELMKEIMFKTGTKGRFGFFGPAEGQMTITQFYDLDNLKKILLTNFKNKKISFLEIRKKLHNNTLYIKKQIREVLLSLEEEGKIKIIGKGPRGGLKDRSMIIFNQQMDKKRICSLMDFINSQ